MRSSRFGVSGVVNIDLTPEFAAKLSAALGAALPKGSYVAINRDAHRSARMLKRALVSGLPGTGINVWDLTSVAIPVLRHFVRQRKDTSAGIHVRLSPFDQRVVDIRIIDSQGLNQSSSATRDRTQLLPRGLPAGLLERDRVDRLCARTDRHVYRGFHAPRGRAADPRVRLQAGDRLFAWIGCRHAGGRPHPDGRRCRAAQCTHGREQARHAASGVQGQPGARGQDCHGARGQPWRAVGRRRREDFPRGREG